MENLLGVEVEVFRACINLTARATPEGSGNTKKYVKDFYLKAKARTWPCQSYMCHVRLTAVTLGIVTLALISKPKVKTSTLNHNPAISTLDPNPFLLLLCYSRA